MRCHRYHLAVASLAAWTLMISPARAQVTVNFEPPAYAGSAAGTLLTGQQGWYNPVAGSVDYNVFTYAGNTLGLPVNPTGGTQFAGGLSAGGTTIARGQLDVNFTSFSTWTLSYDFAHRYNGTLPTADNLGSFSLQPSTTARSFIALHTWGTDTATATTFNAQFNVFDAAGVALNNQSPGAQWTGLLINNWYRESVTVDFTSNQVLSVSLTNLATSTTNTFNPPNWYMLGGAGGGTAPLPTAVRIFAGGAAGNVAGWDNLSVTPVPEPSSIVLFGVGLLGVLGRRYRRRRESENVTD
jgi:PEP-CTERM motif